MKNKAALGFVTLEVKPLRKDFIIASVRIDE
ncbi:hypothetical protein SAMN05443529_106136 [Desulfosporosinus hippei DSM 8344]|uniref:Uncharacterized protein n=1 Tax=Desulfosporosinus hippei DSM 8344 TaxID=1121419 RepID=A0A1G7X616_9FIRM|nr:hypothetical protein SAMN05443529_106136 [Desulfosporosinus hippei DSM 8344]